MANFKDRSGREWSISVDYNTVEAVKKWTGFNVLELVNPEKAASLDALAMLAVFWTLCGKQAADRQMSREDFIGALNGDAAEAAGEALEVELINFSPSRLRPTLLKLQTKGRELRAAAMDRADSLIDGLDLAKLLATGSSDGVTNTPASSASIPADLPSAN